jgi:hypothetical protein
MSDDNENRSISLSTVPKLRNNANLTAWQQTVETVLLIAGCIGIIDGTDREPHRKEPVETRSIRAGSIPPAAAESDTDLC